MSFNADSFADKLRKLDITQPSIECEPPYLSIYLSISLSLSLYLSQHTVHVYLMFACLWGLFPFSLVSPLVGLVHA